MHVFVVFDHFSIKTAMYCFGKFYFLLAIGDMLAQKRFRYPGFGLLGTQYKLPDIG